MFYVSRIVGHGRYGVVDTEDGCEDIMTTAEIKHAVIDMGVEIKGVSLRANRGGRPALNPIVVYQPSGVASRTQVKAKVLHGLDIKKNGDTISSIEINQVMNCGSVRLSSYGTKFGAYVFKSRKILGNVTFVLDDSLEIDKRTFKDWWQFGGISMDLRLVTNQKIVDAVLEAIDLGFDVAVGELSELNRRVLDRPERHGYAVALWVISTEFVNDKQIAVVQPFIGRISPSVQELIRKKYYRKFLNLGKSPVKIREDVMLSDLDIKHGIIVALRQAGLNADSSFDDWKRETVKYGFVSSLEYVVKTDFKALMALHNYVMLFNAEDDIKKSYVQYCDKACEAIWVAYKTRW